MGWVLTCCCGLQDAFHVFRFRVWKLPAGYTSIQVSTGAPNMGSQAAHGSTTGSAPICIMVK